MIKVIPYILTAGNENFKNFLLQPFDINMLYPTYSAENNCKLSNILFYGWIENKIEKNMSNNWYEFSNNEKIILDFYEDSYIIRNSNNTIFYKLPKPKTINDFINNMNMFNIQLYWTTWIDENFEPKDYLQTDKISEYYVDLLTRIGKSNELL